VKLAAMDIIWAAAKSAMNALLQDAKPAIHHIVKSARLDTSSALQKRAKAVFLSVSSVLLKPNA
jgi:hypothetical protein